MIVLARISHAGVWLWLTTAATVTVATAADTVPERRTWTVDGVTREALVMAPHVDGDSKRPCVFVFHGHGGNMQNSARLGFQKLWPEAVIVCPQGLPTATARDPEGNRSGWQPGPDANGNRDLKFFDAMRTAILERDRVDPARVYATGHSNGGGFTYLLGITRSSDLAAIAPSAAGSGAFRGNPTFTPRPILHLAGEQDNVVSFESQLRVVNSIKQRYGMPETGREWPAVGTIKPTEFKSPEGLSLVVAVHPGTHKYPDEAPQVIVKFFKEHRRPEPRANITSEKPDAEKPAADVRQP